MIEDLCDQCVRAVNCTLHYLRSSHKLDFLLVYFIFGHSDRLRKRWSTRSLTPVFYCLHSSANYEQSVDCVSKSVQICTNHQLSESQIRGIVYKSHKESTLCLDGIAAIPTMPPGSEGLPCSASFSSNAEACVRTFHEKYAADKSDPSLCQ